MAKPRRTLSPDDHLDRVRRLCLALPESSERFSHGEPTFFVRNKVFVMFPNNHHGDGHIAVWLPVPPGFQAGLIEASPKTFFHPPYVGVRGWVGIELSRITDERLCFHIDLAWELVAPRRLVAQQPFQAGQSKPPSRARPARSPKRSRTR